MPEKIKQRKKNPNMQKRLQKVKVKKVKETNIKKKLIDSKQVEELIVKLYKQGYKPEKIGLILRDSYGIGDVKAVTGKKIVKILREKGFNVFPPDLEALIEKVKDLRKHYEKNKKDYTAKRALQIIEARVRILSKYYKKKGILASDFNIKP